MEPALLWGCCGALGDWSSLKEMNPREGRDLEILQCHPTLVCPLLLVVVFFFPIRYFIIATREVNSRDLVQEEER